MKKMLLPLFVFLLGFFSSNAQLTLLTGVENGSYYQMGKELNKHTSVDLNIMNSQGSRDNFFKLKESEVDLAFIQYDVLFYQTGLEEDISSKVENIKILLPMGYEEIHLLTLKENNINSVADLKRKKVGVGSKFMGTIITVSYIRDIVHGKWKDVKIPVDDAIIKLYDGKIDALFFVGSAPIEKISFMPDAFKNKMKLVPIKNPGLNAYYAKVTIPKSTYSFMTEDVPTYAVRYALTTNITNENDLKREQIRQLLEDIHKNIGELKESGHPMWKHVDFTFDRIIWDVHDISKEIFNLQNIENKF